MGLREIDTKIKVKRAYEQKGDELALEELERLITHTSQIKKTLKKLEKRYKNSIMKNKQVWEQFITFRETMGLPAKIGEYTWKKRPSLKDKLTGGGFYDELARKILEVGKEQSQQFGGIMTASQILLSLQEEYLNRLTIDDVYRAIEKLVKQKFISSKPLSSGTSILEFIPVELSEDYDIILNLFSQKGFMTKEELILKTDWQIVRIDRIIEDLVKKDIAVIDKDYTDGTKIYIRCFYE